MELGRVLNVEKTINQYLAYLRLQREQPSLHYLQRLIQHHLTFVPYESFSKFHYSKISSNFIPTLPLFVENLIEKGWGGTCFTLNINFARLLTQLGYSCNLVRVVPGHLAIMVEFSGKNYYVDIGYGSPIMKPIELEAKPVHVLHGFGEEIIIAKKDESLYEIDRRSNGKSFVKKDIIWEPLTEEDISHDIYLSYLDTDENITMRRISAVRFNGHQCLFLRNETLKIITFRNIHEIRMDQYNHWIDTVRERFHIDEDSIHEAVRFLEERGVHLFH